MKTFLPLSYLSTPQSLSCSLTPSPETEKAKKQQATNTTTMELPTLLIWLFVANTSTAPHTTIHISGLRIAYILLYHPTYINTYIHIYLLCCKIFTVLT